MHTIYTQTNETDNAILAFSQGADGTLTPMGKVMTGGKGSNGLSSATGENNVPDSLLSSNSVIASKDGKWLFAVNAGDNSVSCFMVAADGSLSLSDVKPTGNAVTGASGTASTLAYNDGAGVLYVSHSFGPQHIKSFKVDGGKLMLTAEAKSVNTPDMMERMPTQLLLAPDAKFLLAFVLFDARPTEAGLSPAKMKNVVVFPVAGDGMLGEAMFNEAGGVAPFAGCFLHNKPDTFVTVLAAESSAVLNMIDASGRIMSTMPAKISTMMDGKAAEPSEICWVSVTEDDKYAFGTNFGYGTVSSFAIGADGVKVIMDTAAKEEGDGNYKGLANVVSSGPGDSAVCGTYFYQLYANAAKIVGYAIDADGSLKKVTEQAVPRNSSQGLVRI